MEGYRREFSRIQEKNFIPVGQKIAFTNHTTHYQEKILLTSVSLICLFPIKQLVCLPKKNLEKMFEVETCKIFIYYMFVSSKPLGMFFFGTLESLILESHLPPAQALDLPVSLAQRRNSGVASAMIETGLPPWALIHL